MNPRGPALRRDLVCLRLANEIEEYLHRAKIYTGKPPVPASQEALTGLARGLGEVLLAEALAQLCQAEGPPVPPAIQHRYRDKLRTPRTSRRTASAVARSGVTEAWARARRVEAAQGRARQGNL